jgi:hypothetical protein
LNPSQTVERIREILVGRQFDLLERRVSLLEARAPQPPTAGERHSAGESKFAELRQEVRQQLDEERRDIERNFDDCRGEIRRLSAHIQEVAAIRAAESASGVRDLEAKLGGWLGTWQTSLQTHLAERDERLAGQLRGEVAALWENTEEQLTRLESRVLDRESVEERFRRISIAARALAECAAPSANPSEPPR